MKINIFKAKLIYVQQNHFQIKFVSNFQYGFLFVN